MSSAADDTVSTLPSQCRNKRSNGYVCFDEVGEVETMLEPNNSVANKQGHNYSETLLAQVQNHLGHLVRQAFFVLSSFSYAR